MALNPSVKKVIQPTTGKLVNYNFFDTAAGTGYITYYAGTMSGANILSNETFYSNDVTTTSSLIASSAYVLMIDKDFDIKYNVPTLIGGVAIVDVPTGSNSSSASATTESQMVIVKVRKWDGVTETDLAQGSAPEWDFTAGTTGKINYKMRTAQINVPKTLFKKDEYLRITAELWAHEANGTQINNHYAIMGHDPMNRAANDGEPYAVTMASGSSVFKVQIPLKLDI